MKTGDNDAATSRLHELRHRFRNSLQIVNSLVGLHARGISDPIAKGAFADLRARLSILSTIFMDLDEEDGESVDLESFVPRIAHKAANLQPGDVACPLELTVASGRMETSRAASLAQILSEMLMDAFRRCGQSGEGSPVEVRLADEGKGQLVLTVGTSGAVQPDTAAQKLSHAIIGSMAQTLDANFRAPEGAGGKARLEFGRDAK